MRSGEGKEDNWSMKVVPRPGKLPEGSLYSDSIFVDSGAHSIYNIEVLKHGKRDGDHGRELAKPPVRWSQGDFSYYDLTKGTPFRAYCDNYAAFMKKMAGRDILLANVDAISSPEITWKIQRFFEEEHGVQPVPIIHFGTPMKWVDRYVQARVKEGSLTKMKYELLGVGGLGQGVSRHEYFRWGDEFFTHICPKENSYLPLIRTHGFAMTSWELICRWPWWSVDSATWVKLSAYGWLYIPRWSDRHGWRMDRPPLMINLSFRSPQKEIKGKHFDNCIPEVRETALRWLKYLGLEMGTVDKEGEMVVFGVSSHHRARSIANLSYLKLLEQSRPLWPHPLDSLLVQDLTVKYHRGFGL